MTNLRKAAEMALEVLESYRGQVNVRGESPAADACSALRAALAELDDSAERAYLRAFFNGRQSEIAWEREACAMLIESMECSSSKWHAEAIRARGEP